MRKINKTTCQIIILILALSPFVAFAQLPRVGPASWGALANSLINFLLNLVIPVAVIMIVWSGIVLMTAGGAEDRVTQGKKYFTWALIGLTIALIGKGLVVLIKDVLGG